MQESTQLRLLAIALAMLTDSIDGYLARRNQTAGKFGAILDPAMDKFFVAFALAIFYSEAKLTLLQLFAMVSRDFFLFLYGLFISAFRGWRSIALRPIRWGKVTTALQFLVLMGLTLGVEFSWVVYASFIAMGFLAFLEMLQISNPLRSNEAN